MASMGCPLALKNFHPHFVEGIFVVVDTNLANIMVVDIEKADTKVVLIQLAFAHHFSLSRYPLFFPAVVELLCSIFHHGLLIYKIYNTN